MSIERLTKDMNIIAKLPDEPNDVGGLTAEELKGKFDEGGVALKEFINETLLPALEELGVEHTVQCVDPTLLKYLTVGEQGELRYSADGVVWSILPGGVDGKDGTDGKNGTDGDDGTGFICCTEYVPIGATDVPVTKSQLKYPAMRPIQNGDLVLCANGTVCLISYYSSGYYHLKSTGISIKGADGAAGEQGPQGEQGPAGADGARGATGASGEDGTGFVYCTTSFSGTSAGATGSMMKFPAARMPQKGDLVLCADGTVWYISGGAWNAVNYSTSTATYTLTSTGISLKGADGEQGPQGEQGLQGEQGPTGADGAKGADGKDGADGYTPVRGTDYWTQEDQAAIVADVLEQLPEGGGTGGSSGETEETLTTILEEQTVEFAGDPVTIAAPAAISVGETYTVVWDGAKYELTAEGASDGEVTLPVLGSAAYATGSEEDNGLPFVIVYAPAELTGTETDRFIMLAIAAGTHTVAIYTKAIFPVQTLDGFVLNEDFGAYVYTVTPAPFTPVIGDICTVKWDGVSFSCKVQDASVVGGEGAVALGDMSSFGGVGNGEQFVIGWMQGALLFVGFNTETSHVVGIYSEGGNKPLLPAVDVNDDGKFLRVVNGAWTAVVLDSAEEASF